VTSPVAAGTNSTVDIATYYKELSGGLVTTLSISPSTLPPSQENSHLVPSLSGEQSPCHHTPHLPLHTPSLSGHTLSGQQ
jgi:hypothetical protein